MKRRLCIIFLSLILILGLTACGNKETTSTNEDVKTSITVEDEEARSKFPDPYTMDINELKELLTNPNALYANGEILNEMFIIYAEDHNLYADIVGEEQANAYREKGGDAFKVDDNSTLPFAPAYRLGQLIFYKRTGEILESPSKDLTYDLQPEKDITTVKVELSESDTDFQKEVDDLYERTANGDEEAAKQLIEYFSPTKEFIESLTLDEFKIYFKKYVEVMGYDYAPYEEALTSDEMWVAVKQSFMDTLEELEE